MSLLEAEGEVRGKLVSDLFSRASILFLHFNFCLQGYISLYVPGGNLCLANH